MNTTRRRGRLLDAAQWALLGMYLLGSVGVLLLAVVRTGDWGALADPGLERLGDPKDAIPFGWDSVANPFAWIIGTARVVAMLIIPAAALGVILGGLALSAAARERDRRRIARAVLFIAAWLLVVAVAFTEYGDKFSVWLAD
ncbi:hypothetical protein QLQ12_00705 [Actinoplanes sp. NEAU-A12]|uniref:Uncharacterized protein n=1 Tax=Actinoplanes sandaracinus TaxID=3045177 RepID=A0ABT6WBR2_9ACTN|nr:hypothetical protein [Actinoplanes sandaracinus]MDI6097127.1 hypothetical protein [Actinoplanes sandaracinus]